MPAMLLIIQRNSFEGKFAKIHHFQLSTTGRFALEITTLLWQVLYWLIPCLYK